MIIKHPVSPTAHSVIYQSITKTMLNIENSNEAHITFQINTFVLVEVLLISLTLIGIWNIFNGITSFSYSVWKPISSIQDQIQEDKHVYQTQWQWKLHIWPHKYLLIFGVAKLLLSEYVSPGLTWRKYVFHPSLWKPKAPASSSNLYWRTRLPDILFSYTFCILQA